jgi:hypothetical protein
MLRSIGEIYGVGEFLISIIVRKFCRLVWIHLYHLFVQFSNENQFRALANEFEAFHGISQVIALIDELHISVLLQ